MNKTGGNGGTGGGGGGGKWLDRITTASGYDGGGGFTGGGKGGTNYPLTGSGNYKTTGIGTYGVTDGSASDPKRGSSINGVEPPFQNTYNWEAAGGGTGHPFGFSGINTDDGNTPTPPNSSIGYGGGSGWSQKKAGGAGSYASIGKAPTAETAGKIHGNIQIVPFAGGSGGASGNPEGVLLNLDVDAGSGGGGGGALRVFAKYIENIYINVNGGDGETGENNAHGGGGSGGAVELDSKSEIKKCQISALGGNFGTNREGGEGYLRIDFNTFPEVVPLPAHFYQGISTDSTYKVYRDFECTYTGSTTAGSSCSLYRRIDGESQWTKMPNPPSDFVSNWSIKYTPTGNHKYEYFVLILDNAGLGTAKGANFYDSLHNFDPRQLMAQNAANIFVLKDAYPDLVAPDELSVNTICENETYDFDFVVKNDGMKDLILSIDKSYFQNSNPHFALITPTNNVTLPEGQSQTFKIRYTPDPSELYNIRDTFMLFHNDTAGPKLKRNPYPIALSIDSVIYTNLTFIGSPDFGVIQIGKPKTNAFIFRNDGNIDIKISTLPVVSPPFTLISSVPSIPPPATLKPGQSVTFNIQYDPTDENINKTDFSVAYNAEKYNCQDDNQIKIQGKGSMGVLSYPTQVDLGFMNWCDPDTIDLMFQNTSTNPGDLIRIMDKPILTGTNASDFRIISAPTMQYPLTINMQDAIQYSVVLDPTGKPAGKYTANVEIITDLIGSEKITIPITAEIAQFDMKATPANLNFGNVYVGFDSPIINLELQNDGVLQEHIQSVQYPPELTFTRISGSDYLAIGGGLNKYTSKLHLNTGGNYTGNLLFNFDEPCSDQLLVQITANGLLSEITVIDTLDFGVHPSCAVNILKDIRFSNNSPAPYVIIQGSEQLIDDPGGFFLLHATGLSQVVGVHDTINPTKFKDAGQIIFDSRTGFTGKVFAKYRVQVYQNGIYKDVYVVLKAEIDPGSYKINNNPTVFVPTIINQKSQKTVEIENTGRWNMKILSITTPTKPEFTILANSVIGTTLGPNQKTSFNIEFYPKSLEVFQDFITVEFLMDSCKDQVSIQLDAIGGKSRTLLLSMPDTLLLPDIDNCRIPIYAKLKAGDDPISNYTIDTIKLSFNRSLFFPKNIYHDIIEFANDDRIISFTVNNLNLTTNEQIIAYLEGATMLGNQTSTAIKFDKVILPNDGEITDINTKDGSLEITICKEGGDRLLINAGAKPDVLLVPNPATDIVNITAIMIEKGNYTLEIYDLLGKKTLIQTWTKPTGGKEEKLISFDATALSNGIYIIRLTVPSQTTINKTLNITK
ncbi:MAG: choice-of-anchor D domain-containing protein [bacterium]